MPAKAEADKGGGVAVAIPVIGITVGVSAVARIGIVIGIAVPGVIRIAVVLRLDRRGHAGGGQYTGRDDRSAQHAPP